MEHKASSFFLKILLLLFVLAFIVQGSVFDAHAIVETGSPGSDETGSAVSGNADNSITDDIGIIMADDAASAAEPESRQRLSRLLL